MQMLDWLKHWLENDNSYIIYLFVLLGGGETLDMIIGTTIAKFSKKKDFSSSRWKQGILYKLFEFGLTVYLLPLFVMFGDYGIALYTTMVIGLILAEVYSILGHLNIVDDKKVNVFKEFLEKLIKKDK